MSSVVVGGFSVPDINDPNWKKLPDIELCHHTKSRWPELPQDLLELILIKVTPSAFDILRFKGICRSWRTAAKSFAKSFARWHQNPWLLLHTNHRSSLIDPAEKKVYKTRNVYDDFPGGRCVGSSHGWIVMFYTDEDGEKSFANLFNPISRAHIQIPGAQTLSICSYSGISKAIVSANPSITNNFFVVVSCCNGLAFCKPKDKSWSQLHNAAVSCFYHDIMFYHEQLFALARDQSLEIWQCRESSLIKIRHLQDSTRSSSFESSYLVESLGDILRMRKVDSISSLHFLVEKLNLTNGKWEKVQNLGDRILFLFDDRQLMSMSRSWFIGCRQNSICIGSDPIHIYNLAEDVVDRTESLGILLIGKPQDRLLYDSGKKSVWMVPSL